MSGHWWRLRGGGHGGPPGWPKSRPLPVGQPSVPTGSHQKADMSQQILTPTPDRLLTPTLVGNDLAAKVGGEADAIEREVLGQVSNSIQPEAGQAGGRRCDGATQAAVARDKPVAITHRAWQTGSRIVSRRGESCVDRRPMGIASGKMSLLGVLLEEGTAIGNSSPSSHVQELLALVRLFVKSSDGRKQACIARLFLIRRISFIGPLGSRLSGFMVINASTERWSTTGVGCMAGRRPAADDVSASRRPRTRSRSMEEVSRRRAGGESLRPKVHERHESGRFADGKLILQIQPNRVDWLYIPEPDASEGDQRQKPFPVSLDIFRYAMLKWLNERSAVQRMAFGAILRLPVANREEGCRQISSFLPFRSEPGHLVRLFVSDEQA